eukprot:s1486_g13.t1
MLFLNILVVSSWPDAGDCAGKRQFSGSNEERLSEYLRFCTACLHDGALACRSCAFKDAVMGVVEQLNCTAREFVHRASDAVQISVSYHFDQGHSHARRDAKLAETEFASEAEAESAAFSEARSFRYI